MTEGDPVEGAAAGPESAGERLRAAREAQGLTIDEVSARTRVPVRHLEAIESGAYASLPSGAYAVGFARAYARAVGLSDPEIARAVRAEVDVAGPKKPVHTPFEMADPARVPSRGLAVVAAGLALAVLILGGLWFASTRFGPGAGSAPSASEGVVASIPAAPAPAPAPAPTAAAPTGGQVTLAAADEVWLRVYDADDRTLFVGTMSPGQRFDVPAGARDPRIDVGRPDKLQVTLNGSAVPPLGTGERPIKDVRVSGEAIAARLSGAGASSTATTAPAAFPVATVPVTGPSALPRPATQSVASRSAAPKASAARAAPGRERQVARARPRPRPRRVLTETQRANLESAASLRGEAPR